MRIGKGEPVQLECTMPNGNTQWLTYEQWQQSSATWTGGIVGHRAKADIIREVLAQTDRKNDSRA